MQPRRADALARSFCFCCPQPVSAGVWFPPTPPYAWRCCFLKSTSFYKHALPLSP